MRIPSGSTDRKLYFVAVDATDLKTRETALSSFTVYRSRDGGVAAVYTTPTVAEISAANMPGLYVLTIDEDTTIGATHDTEEYVVHITQASMAPVTRSIELYRPKFTEGQAATMANSAVDADLERIAGVVVSTTTAQLGVNVVNAAGTAWGSGAVTAASLATGAITAAKFAAGAIDAAAIATDAIGSAEFAQAAADKVWSSVTRLLTAGTNIVLAKGTGVTGFNDLSAAQVNTEVDTAIVDARLDELLVADSDIDGVAPPTVGSVFHELMTKSTASFTFDQTTDSVEAIRDALPASSDPWATALPGAYGAGTAGNILGNRLDAAITTRSSHTAADVWTSGTRTLTAFAFSVTVGTNNDKTGYELSTAGVTAARSIVSGTADSGTTTTMVDAARTEADTNYWKDKWLLFTSGTISGQCVLITAFDPVLDQFTFTPATTQAVGTNTYEILPGGPVDLYLWNGTAPNNLIAGRVDANAQVVADKTGYSVSIVSTGAIVAGSFAAGAIDNAAFAVTETLNATIVAAGISATSFAANAIDSGALAASAVNEIADGILSRNVSNVEATCPEHCLATVILATLESSVSGTSWTIKRTDGITTLYVKTLTRDPNADPVIGIT